MKNHLFSGAVLLLGIFSWAGVKAQGPHGIKSSSGGGSTRSASATVSSPSYSSSSGSSSSGSSDDSRSSSGFSLFGHKSESGSSSSSSSDDYTSPSPSYSPPSTSSYESSDAVYSAPSSSSSPSSSGGWVSKPKSSRSDAGSGDDAESGISSGSGGDPTVRNEITGWESAPLQPPVVTSPPHITLDELESAVAQMILIESEPTLSDDLLLDLKDKATAVGSLLSRMDEHGHNYQVIYQTFIELNIRIDSRMNIFNRRMINLRMLKEKAGLLPLIWPVIPATDTNARQLSAFADEVLGLPDGGWDYYQNMKYFDPDATWQLLEAIQAEESALMYSDEYFALEQFFTQFATSQWDTEARYYVSDGMDLLDRMVADGDALSKDYASNLNLVCHAILLVEPNDEFFAAAANYTYQIQATYSSETK